MKQKAWPADRRRAPTSQPTCSARRWRRQRRRTVRVASRAAVNARGNLVRSQSRSMIEDLRGDHQFISARAPDEFLQAFGHCLGRADRRTTEDLSEDGMRLRADPFQIAFHWWRKANRVTGAQAHKRLLQGTGEQMCSVVGLSGDD